MNSNRMRLFVVSIVIASLAALQWIPGTGCSTTHEAGGESTRADGGDGGDPDGETTCGNGRVEGDESCDGADLDGQDCGSVGEFTGGSLSCTDACTFDTSSCTSTAPCLVNETALVLTIEDGVADTQVVNVTYEGVEGYLAIDTGSPLTFVFGEPGDPEYVPHIGDVALGCETVPMALLTLEALGVEYFQGKPIFGILGIDFFTEVASEIDYPQARVVRYLEQDPDLAGTAEVPALFGEDRILVDGTLDQQPVRLIYDAGSHHTIWVGVPGKPGDEEVLLGTADGGTVMVWEGSAVLAMGNDEPRSIVVWRAPDFPYLEEELDELGAQGLLGATGMGFRRIVFDPIKSALWLGPINSTP